MLVTLFLVLFLMALACAGACMTRSVWLLDRAGPSARPVLAITKAEEQSGDEERVVVCTILFLALAFQFLVIATFLADKGLTGFWALTISVLIWGVAFLRLWLGSRQTEDQHDYTSGTPDANHITS